MRWPPEAPAVIAIGRSAPFAYTFPDSCSRGLVLIMGPETVHGCLAFMTGPAAEAFLTRSNAARLPYMAAMDIDISYGGRPTARSFLA